MYRTHKIVIEVTANRKTLAEIEAMLELLVEIMGNRTGMRATMKVIEPRGQFSEIPVAPQAGAEQA